MCASDKTNRDTLNKEFSLEEAISFMDDAVGMGLEVLLINGGEPTIHPHIVQIIKEGVARFETVVMASNGRRFSDMDFARTLVESGLDAVGIPVYSTSSEKFDYIVQSLGAFKEVMKGISNLSNLSIDHNLKIALKILVMRPNYQENPDVVQMIKDHFPEPYSITLAGLRVGAKAFQRKDELFIPYNIARPYTSEALRRVLPYKFNFDFLPLCALEPDLVIDLIKQGLIKTNLREHILRRPDGLSSDGREPFHYEPCCLECDVYNACSKVHTKNVEELSYDSQLRAVSIS